MNKLDPSWKETPNMPGELYDEVFFCSYCDETIDISKMETVYTCDGDQPLCEDCAGYLEIMWSIEQIGRLADQHD